ncbi:MAG: NAD(P) transhydrogenase subunit alpha [Phycisphaerales bacterium]|nr:MAG: NAD(P) transhydrogenase subunit alpha [Phycisphaerales bacterium]
MIVGVVKETFPGERRVALVPGVLPYITKRGAEVIVEGGAGLEAGYTDAEFEEKGAKIVADHAEIYAKADIVCTVRTYAANLDKGAGDLDLYRKDQVIIGLSEPLTAQEPIDKITATGVKLFALELIPRTTRGQAMDVLSSQATVAGYYCVALAQTTLPKMFPMMMTAAGTIKPAKVFVIGAGVAGLQCIASAKKAGAVVYGFDVRPEVKEQIESLGAKFLEIEVADARGEGGYARELTDEEKARQRELMADQIAESDVVITTAAVPGKKAPMLIPADVARRMHTGSVIVDMAAERGGNCELTKAGETVVDSGVTILGPTNIPTNLPFHASQMFAKNVQNLLDLLITNEGELQIDMEDEIIVGTLECEDGQIIHKMAREIFGLQPLEEPKQEQAPAAEAVAEGSNA